jgi:YD repeat-containing protein
MSTATWRGGRACKAVTTGQLILETTPATSDFPDGRMTRYDYSTGTETAANGGTIPAGLLESVTTPGDAVTSYSYDSNGDLAQVTESSGRYTDYTYDLLGRPLTSTVYTSTYPSGEQTTYSYTPTGQQATVTYPVITNSVAATRRRCRTRTRTSPPPATTGTGGSPR